MTKPLLTSTSAVAVLATAAAGLAAVTGAPAAHAAKSDTCAGFSVVVNGTTYRGEQERVIPARAVGSGPIRVRGKYVRFSVQPSTFAARNYTLTGADSPDPDKDLPLDGPTVVFESKVPNHGAVLTSGLSLELRPDGVVMERSGAGQDMKIQAKNCAQGGIFQMEPEPGTTYTHRLGPDFRYAGESPTADDRLCITNGAFSAYESPELATLLAPADGQGTTSRWRVRSGGRMGFVVGEDAVEGGCTA